MEAGTVLYCDVKLRVGTEVFPAHRNVLAAESTFLSTLFAGQFAEALAPIVDIREMDLRVFKLALDYMYDGSCLVPDVSTLQQLLSVASVLQIDALFAAAATALDQSLTLDNCASMLACADQHHVPQLALRAEAMARDVFVDVASNPAFPASSMVALLQSNCLNVESEEQVFETLSTWLKGQVEPLSEEEHLQMFGLVRFTLLSQDFRDSTVMAEPSFSMPRARNLVLARVPGRIVGWPNCRVATSPRSVQSPPRRFFRPRHTAKSSRGWIRVLQRSCSCCIASHTMGGKVKTFILGATTRAPL